MKIAYIGSFKRLFDEEGIARSFEALGHQVIRFNEAGFHEGMIQQVLDTKADILLFAKLKIEYALRDRLIDSFPGKTVCYVPDLYWGLSRQYLPKNRDTIFRADFVLTPDGGNDALWKESRVNHYCVRQGIYDKEIGYIKGKKIHDLTFVGAINPQFPYRKSLISFVSNNFNLHWVGGRREDECRGKALSELIGASKVVLGDSVKSPRYWSNRIYETIGRGGMIIHPMTEGLDEEYEPYKHFIPYEYGDFNGLRAKIDYYIKHPEEAEKIALAGMEYTREHHTLLNRCEQILNIVKNG